MKRYRTRLVFDLETESFSQAFCDAETEEERRKHAPKLRVACVYDEAARRYRYYTERSANKLVDELLLAEEVISFNGKQFDLLVLQRHHGLSTNQPFPTKGRHIDIHEIMTAEAGFRVSLDLAVRINFGERKHTGGRAMSELSLDQLKIACRSDVSQTYRLWQTHARGALRIPAKMAKSRDWDVGPGEHMPNICPNCHDVASLSFLPADMEEMTEGQLADYLAGVWGYALCHTCGSHLFWQM